MWHGKMYDLTSILLCFISQTITNVSLDFTFAVQVLVADNTLKVNLRGVVKDKSRCVNVPISGVVKKVQLNVVDGDDQTEWSADVR